MALMSKAEKTKQNKTPKQKANLPTSEKQTSSSISRGDFVYFSHVGHWDLTMISERYIKGCQGESTFLPMQICLYDPWIIGWCMMSSRNRGFQGYLSTSWATTSYADSIWAFEASFNENGQTRILCLTVMIKNWRRYRVFQTSKI